MAGIYIHIPFCRQACHYCDFHFSTSLKSKPALLKAMGKEIILRQPYLKGQEIETIYFGGGTPSLLEVSELQLLLDSLRKSYKINKDAEVTLEANPDDITPEKARSWNSAGINRLSIGIQSFSDEDLQYMNRCHTSAEGLESIRICREAGFDNLTIDLIYGTPTMSDKQWRQNLECAIETGVTHISSYCLTVEKGTALYNKVRSGNTKAPEEEQGIKQFLVLRDMLGQAGFQQYEVSNFCKPGKHSRHNSNYWKARSYLGLGPSAHSFDGSSRQWNVSNNYSYISSLEKDILPFEREQLSLDQQYNEYVLTRLRTIWGCELPKLLSEYGLKHYSHFMTQLKKLDSRYYLLKDEVLTLTGEGLLMADSISSDLMI